MNIVVCTVPRSGSNWFRDMLVCRGYPECSEWLHSTETLYSDQYWPRIRQAHLEHKDFGIKLFIKFMVQSGGIEKICREINNPPNVFIRLIRKDIDAQAVSLANATASDDAHAWFDSTAYGDASTELIEEKVAAIKKQNSVWDERLKNRDHLVVYYEDLKDDPEAEMDRVVEYLESKR